MSDTNSSPLTRRAMFVGHVIGAAISAGLMLGVNKLALIPSIESSLSTMQADIATLTVRADRTDAALIEAGLLRGGAGPVQAPR